jgi:hypothetical protein
LPSATPEWIRDLFLNELNDPANADATVKETLEIVRLVLERNGQEDLLPGIDWAYKLNREWTQTRLTPLWLDQRWSLASNDRGGRAITPEATRDLLDLSVLCDSLGTSFTCRQAIWVAKLIPVVPIGYSLGTFSRLEWLRSWSSIYALEEMRAESHGVKFFDSKNLDFLVKSDPNIFTHHVTQSGRQVPSPENLTVRLRERSGNIGAPAVWAAVMKSLHYRSGNSDERAIGPSVGTDDYMWIPYMIGEAQQSLGIDELKMSEWKLVVAILDGSPRIVGDPLGADSEEEAMSLTETVVKLVSESRLEEALDAAKITLSDRSQIYVQFNK